MRRATSMAARMVAQSSPFWNDDDGNMIWTYILGAGRNRNEQQPTTQGPRASTTTTSSTPPHDVLFNKSSQEFCLKLILIDNTDATKTQQRIRRLRLSKIFSAQQKEASYDMLVSRIQSCFQPPPNAARLKNDGGSGGAATNAAGVTDDHQRHNNTLTVTYRDSDNDEVIIDSSEELTDAIQQHYRTGVLTLLCTRQPIDVDNDQIPHASAAAANPATTTIRKTEMMRVLNCIPAAIRAQVLANAVEFPQIRFDATRRPNGLMLQNENRSVCPCAQRNKGPAAAAAAAAHAEPESGTRSGVAEVRQETTTNDKPAASKNKTAAENDITPLQWVFGNRRLRGSPSGRLLFWSFRIRSQAPIQHCYVGISDGTTTIAPGSSNQSPVEGTVCTISLTPEKAQMHPHLQPSRSNRQPSSVGILLSLQNNMVYFYRDGGEYVAQSNLPPYKSASSCREYYPVVAMNPNEAGLEVTVQDFV